MSTFDDEDAPEGTTGVPAPNAMRAYARPDIAAALNLVPAVGDALATLAGEHEERRRDRVTEFGELLRKAVANDAQLISRLRGSEVLGDMMVRAAETAYDTTSAAKRKAMGLAIATAVLQPREIEHMQLMLSALIDLEPPHYFLLVQMADSEARLKEGKMVAIAIQEPIMTALIRHGIMTTSPVRGGGIVVDGFSTFGRELLRYVLDAL